MSKNHRRFRCLENKLCADAFNFILAKKQDSLTFNSLEMHVSFFLDSEIEQTLLVSMTVPPVFSLPFLDNQTCLVFFLRLLLHLVLGTHRFYEFIKLLKHDVLNQISFHKSLLSAPAVSFAAGAKHVDEDVMKFEKRDGTCKMENM